MKKVVERKKEVKKEKPEKERGCFFSLALPGLALLVIWIIIQNRGNCFNFIGSGGFYIPER